MTTGVSPDALLGKTLHLASDAIPWVIDPETKDVTGTVTREDQVQAYFAKCEELGLA